MSFLTTSLHLLVLLVNAHVSYYLLIITATTASVIYHANEQNTICYIIDHIIAFIWAVIDAYYNTATIWLNLLTAIICYLAGKKYHNHWHVFNAAKSIYVAYILFSN